MELVTAVANVHGEIIDRRRANNVNGGEWKNILFSRAGVKRIKFDSRFPVIRIRSYRVCGSVVKIEPPPPAYESAAVRPPFFRDRSIRIYGRLNFIS